MALGVREAARGGIIEVLIVGGGIGGLTAALCLQQGGHEVMVFERAPELGEIRAGIHCAANAVMVLDSLGLREELEKVVVRPEAARFRLYDTGETLHEVKFGATYEARYGAPYFHIHGADIHSILARAFQSVAQGAVHLGAHAVGFEERARGVTRRLANGRSFDGDVLVGVVENDACRDESWTVKAPWEELKADYAGWAPTVQSLIDAVDKNECYRWALFNRLPIDNWST